MMLAGVPPWSDWRMSEKPWLPSWRGRYARFLPSSVKAISSNAWYDDSCQASRAAMVGEPRREAGVHDPKRMCPCVLHWTQ